MISWLVQRRKGLVGFKYWLEDPFGLGKESQITRLGYFVLFQFGLIAINSFQFVVEVPVYFRHYPTTAFQLLAQRDSNQSFLEAYSQHLRRYQMAVVTVLASLLLLVAEVYVSTRGLVYIATPTSVQAYTDSVTLIPTWDITAYAYDYFDGVDCPIARSYFCEAENATTLSTGFNQTGDPANCDVGETGERFYYRFAMKFDLSSVPNNATITDVILNVNVSTSTSHTIELFRVNTDTPDSVSCNTPGNSLYEKLSESSNFTTVSNWNTTGAKSHDLGTTADSDVQTRITTSDLIAIGVRINSSTQLGNIDSVDSSNDPQLVVYYTLPPEAPTSSNHSANTTSAITWTWTDNATADTSNVIHNSSHTVMCTTGAVSGTGSTGSCQETGLSANTQYTRHPNVIDADGNTDGPIASAYTSIETPSGVSFNSVGANSITISATGSLSNLTSGSSGLHFRNTVTLDELLWTQTNTWTNSGLGPNSQYGYDIRARNGDSDTTGFCSAASKYTLSAPPDVTSTRFTSTWYTTAAFPFTNNELWGAGGIQYYRYVWNQVSTHAFAGSESTWSDADAKCPGGTCTTANATLTQTATSDANNWYLHVQSFNGDNVANGTGTNYGSYFFDNTNPTAPATVNDGAGSDVDFTVSTTTLSANWTTASDATSGLQKYQYAIGTTAGGTQTLGYTDNGTSTSVTNSSLTLSDGQIYYVSVRAVDNAGNTGSATSSDGITVSTGTPTITDNQAGDTTPRNAAGTTYNVDFTKSASGPNLDYAQYQVWSGVSQTGTLVINWTNIFTSDTVSYTTNWQVNFAGLQQGTNYVSVRVFALDAQSSTLNDAFTIKKDTVNPIISNISVSKTTATATVTWTTNESTNSKLEYGLTSGYGNQVTSGALVTNHSLGLSGLSAGTTYHYRLTGTDEAGNVSSPSNATFTTNSPSPSPTPTPSSVKVPTIENLVNGDIIVDPAQLVTGTGPANAAIFIVTDRMINTVVLSDGQGYYSVRLKAPLGRGQHSILARARTAASEVSDESVPITVTLVPPGIPVTVLERIVRDGDHPSVTFKAVAPTGSTVQVFLDGAVIKSFRAEPSDTKAFGFFTDVTPNDNLAIGRHSIHFVAVNRNGLPSLPTGHTIFTKTSTSNGEALVYGTNVQYQVKSGDSLWKIAETFLGNGARWDEIRQSNLGAFPSLNTNPTTIHAGWVLTIPPS